MQWSKLSNVQRAYLGGSRQHRDTIKNGRVVSRGAPKSATGVAMLTAFALDRDAQRDRDQANKLASLAALASLTPDVIAAVTRKVEAAKAYGAYQRRKGQALPMQYFRRGGSFA